MVIREVRIVMLYRQGLSKRQIAGRLGIHRDTVSRYLEHGSVYLPDDFQEELRFLGIESSPAFVREPEGNGCIERFFRTLKENLLWVRDFATIEELCLALLEFRRLYNEHWILERHGYLTPSQVRAARATRQDQAA